MRNLLPAARSASRRTLRGIRRLSLVEWSLTHWYAAFALWGVALLVVPPAGPAAALGGLLDVAAILLFIGTVLAIIGAIAGAQPRTIGNLGMLAEALGLTWIMAGVVSYLLAQIALSTAPIVGRDRYALAVFAYTVVASLLVRGLFLLRKIQHVGEPASRKVIH